MKTPNREGGRANYKNPHQIVPNRQFAFLSSKLDLVGRDAIDVASEVSYGVPGSDVWWEVNPPKVVGMVMVVRCLNLDGSRSV